MKKVKVLHIIGALSIGGAENVAMNFCRYLDKNKFTCDYLIYSDDIGEYEDEAKMNGANIFRITSPTKSYRHFVYDLVKILKNEQYDVVHAHNLLNNGIVLLLAKICGIKKLVCHSHSTNSGGSNNFIYLIYERLMKFLIKIFATDFIACGVDAGNYLYGQKLFNKKGKVVLNGIDMKKYTYSEETETIVRKELEIDNDTIVLGHVGRFSPVKNHDFLIDLFYEFWKENKNSKLLLVGDGELREEIQKKIENLGIESSVIITGVRMDVEKIMQVIDVFIFPSFYEGFPLALIEAQAIGIPCLVSDNITKQAQITNLINYLDLNSSFQEWIRCIKTTKIKSKKKETINLISSEFDINSTIKEMEKIYANKI